MALFSEVFESVCRVSWQAAILVVLIVLAQRLLRNRLTPAWRHALWGLLVVRLVLLWSPHAPWSVFNAEQALREQLPRIVQVLQREGAGVAGLTAGPVFDRAVTSGEWAGGTSEGPSKNSFGTPSPMERPVLSAPTALSGIVEQLPWIWLAGALLLLAAMVYQGQRMALRVGRCRLVTDSAVLDLFEGCKERTGVSAWLALAETDRVKSPLLLGAIRPRLLLPDGFIEATPRDQLRHVFLHELAHFRRGDIWTGWLLYLLLAVHWFNPVLWWAARRIQADRELACDAHVLSKLAYDDRIEYGHTLLEQFRQFERPAWVPGLAGVLEGTTKLERRLTMITHFKALSRWSPLFGVATLLVLGAVSLTDAQEREPSAEIDLAITQPHIWGFTGRNGGTMICAKITNSGSKAAIVDVRFYEGSVGENGTLIGQGGLEIPAGQSATEAIPWPLDFGMHTVTVVVDPENEVAESDETNNTAVRQIAFAHGRFTHENMLIDDIDRPFEDDPKVLGRWVSVDFVEKMDDFDPNKKVWEHDLFLKELEFRANGKTPKRWWTWTAGYLMHSGDRTASRYVIKDFDGQPYLFFEWKSGDVMIRHDPPLYYVLRKAPEEPFAYSNGYSHLVAFEPAGDFSPQTPRQLLDVFNKNLHGRTGYFRTQAKDGKLIGGICTDAPGALRKMLDAEPQLNWLATVPMTPERFEAHQAEPQESLP